MNAGSGRAAIKHLTRRWRFRVWAIVLALLGLGLGLVPLFNVLGYELALVMAVVGTILGLDLGAALARELQRSDGPAMERASYPGLTLARTTLAATALPVAIILIPAVIAAVRGIFIPTCDWWFGIKAYLALSVVTTALAGAIGHAIGVATGVRGADAPLRHVRRKLIEVATVAVVAAGLVLVFGGAVIVAAVLAGVLALAYVFVRLPIKPHRGTVLALTLPILVCAAAGLYQFYAAPPVFTYNAILGYFPGNLYDENVELGMPLLWSRLEQLAWVLAAIALVATRLDVPRFRVSREPRPAARRIAPLLLAAASTACGLLLRLYAGELGYSIDREEIAAELGGRIETEHFIIYYANTAEIEKDIALIAADHEFRYAQVVAQLGVAPPGKLRSFYFASREQKGRWFGAKDVEMAKPWRGEIYLDHRAFPHSSLRHEIAHAVASQFGDPLFGVAAKRIAGVPVFINPGIIEGLAVAVDWPAGYERLTPHESVRTMQVMGVTPTINELLSLRFLTVSSARSYQTAGSFLKFLLDTYGAPALRALYSNGGDFDAAYGKPVATLEREWRKMIAAITLAPDVIEGSRERFRHGSVFARPCPHANAARREAAAIANVSGNRNHAIQLMREVCHDAPGEPRYKLELGDYLAAGSPFDKIEAHALWLSLATSNDNTSSLRADAFDRLARVAGLSGNYATITAYIAAARELPVDPNARRQLDAQWLALHHEGPAGPALRGYFFAPPGPLDGQAWASLIILGEPELGLGHYLLGIQKTFVPDWPGAAQSLALALDRGLPDVSFVRYAARKLALAAYRANDRPRVERAIAALRGSGMNEVDRLLAEDWAQRLAFDRAHPHL